MWRWLLICLSLFALSACAPQQSGAEKRALRLWTAFEGEELRVLKELCAAYPDGPVTVLQVPFDEFKRKVLVATPAGQGPELVLGPQDWLGVFSVAQLISPLPPNWRDAMKRELSPVALDGVTYDGQIYAYPVLLDGLALLRNPQLAPRSPQSLDELRDYALELQKGGIKGFYYDLRELYFSWPIFAAYGATVFRAKLEPGLTGPEGVAACLYLRQLRQTGLIPLGAKNDFAKSMFLEQKLAMTVNGPWFLADLRAGKVPYVIEPVPPGPHVAASFVGVVGLMVNRFSPLSEQALALMQYLGSRDSQVQLSLASGRVPANLEAQRIAGQDPQKGADVAAFCKVVQQGVAMPNHPAANAVWDPMKQSLELITKGEVEAGPELSNTDQLIRERIRRMVE